MNSQQIHVKGNVNTFWTVTKVRPVFNVISMMDNEDERMNDTHINNCFNQTISEFVFCKRAATDVLRTTSIPLDSAPCLAAGFRQ